MIFPSGHWPVGPRACWRPTRVTCLREGDFVRFVHGGEAMEIRKIISISIGGAPCVIQMDCGADVPDWRSFAVHAHIDVLEGARIVVSV